MRVVGVLVAGMLVVASCGGDGDTEGGSSPNSMVPPSSCPTPCSAGSMCLLTPNGYCNGDWYCWSDRAWHCAPPDASAPGEGGFDAAEIEASLMGEGTGDGGAGEAAAAETDGANE